VGGRRLNSALIAIGVCALVVARPLQAASPNEAVGGVERAASDSGTQGEVLSVAFRDCESEPLGKQAFVKALALELGRRQLREASLESAGITVSYRCDGVARVRVVLGAIDVDREVRVDDVTSRERARALALAVAELTRGGESATKAPVTADKPSTNDKSVTSDKPVTGDKSASTDKAAPNGSSGSAPPAAASAEAKEPAGSAKAAKTGKRSAPEVRRAPKQEASGEHSAPDERGEDAASASNAAGRRELSVLAAAAARLNLDVSSWSYGGAVGIDYANNEVSLEGFGAKTHVARGTISTGLAAVRVARALPLLHIYAVELGVSASAAGGVNWALGNSTLVNTHVRDVLMPYADAKLSLWATTRTHRAFTPKLEVYAGRAAGIVANADGASATAVGGWFSGCEVGLWL
jgi:hypothetical protein